MNSEERKHAAESWVDEVLSQRIPHPRQGLEGRILTGLRVHEKQRQRQWIFVLAASVAALLFAVVATRGWHARQPDISRRGPVPEEMQRVSSVRAVTAAPHAEATQTSSGYHSNVQKRASESQGSGRAETVAAQEALLPVVIKQEPTRSLTEQAKLLQMYLQGTPKQELKLVAGRQEAVDDIDIPDVNVPSIKIATLDPQMQAQMDAQAQAQAEAVAQERNAKIQPEGETEKKSGDSI